MNNCESEEIVEAANIAISNLLPTKSRSLYDIAYNRFKSGALRKMFNKNAKNYKSSTLWAQYSMVKSCLIIYDNIDISLREIKNIEILPKRPAEDEYGYAFEACLVDQVLQSVEKEVNLILFSPLHP
ncbi:hypothetical protein NQ317_004682 [Molorchus minor]|uniref:Uncharacterized protein n=1 Tax=Molorchus minor TaxID=1323400 RepID=A0ABQ9JFG8_9CUCU|nr:hypothetical protein NQ317_004682 [Molorchus minor]